MNKKMGQTYIGENGGENGFGLPIKVDCLL